MNFYLDGEINFYINGEKKRCGPGSVCLINSEAIHHSEVVKDFENRGSKSGGNDATDRIRFHYEVWFRIYPMSIL